MPFQIGAFFPTRDMPADCLAIRDWAQAAEALGFDFLEVSDHVLGADRDVLDEPRVRSAPEFRIVGGVDGSEVLVGIVRYNWLRLLPRPIALVG